MATIPRLSEVSYNIRTYDKQNGSAKAAGYTRPRCDPKALPLSKEGMLPLVSSHGGPLLYFDERYLQKLLEQVQQKVVHSK